MTRDTVTLVTQRRGLTGREDENGHLDGAANQAVQRKHPVRLDVVRPERSVHLNRETADDQNVLHVTQTVNSAVQHDGVGGERRVRLIRRGGGGGSGHRHTDTGT